MKYTDNDIDTKKDNYTIQYNFANDTMLLFAILFLAVITSVRAILNPQLFGEDESLTFLAVNNILQSIYELDWKTFIFTIGTDWHPPGLSLIHI